MKTPEIGRSGTASLHGEEKAAVARRRFFWLLTVVTAAFGLVRYCCLFNDLWLDEIWSLLLLQGVHSPLEILTRIRHDNNHPLNSLFLYLMMPAKADWTYRLLSWGVGTATVWIAGAIGRRQFRALHDDADGAENAAGIITAVLFGACYVMIHYSSEARGYAPAIGCALLAVYALMRGDDRGGNTWAAVYGVACLLGLLSHVLMFQFMIGGLAWSLMKAWQRRGSGWRAVRDLACWQAAPWTFFGVYYVGFVRLLEIGGGPDSSLVDVLGQLAIYSIGLPTNFPLIVAFGALVAMVAIGLRLVFRRAAAYGCFYLAAMVVAPALGLMLGGFTLLFPRYFIFTTVGAILLAGYIFGRLWRRSGGARLCSALLLAAFVVGHAGHTVRLIRFGRGQYRSALSYIAQRTASTAITVSSDHDDRNSTVMAYYAAAVGHEHRLEYLSQYQLPADGPQWLLLHRFDGEAPPPDPFQIEEQRYRREAIFRHAALSGWDWYVYRNTKYELDRPASAATR